MSHRVIRLLVAAAVAGLAPPVAAELQPPGANPAPLGYKRDERGRLMQTHFDLRRRFMAGVHWAPALDLESGELSSGTAVELGGAYEIYQERKSRRTKFRYLEGRLEIQDIEFDALLFDYSTGRRSREPVFWITTFIGEPRRFDVTLDISPGVMLGRFWRGPLGDQSMLLADFGDVHLDWEVAHGANLEDYLSLRVASGVGLRAFAGQEQSAAYLYPEIAVRAAWLIGARGLTQVGFDGRVRTGWEPSSSVRWYEARALGGLERIVVAVSDQPIALFIQPSTAWIDAPGEDRWETRIDAGVRLSLFAPPRQPDDLCPDEVEDFDYIEDDDGCPEPH